MCLSFILNTPILFNIFKINEMIINMNPTIINIERSNHPPYSPVGFVPLLINPNKIEKIYMEFEKLSKCQAPTLKPFCTLQDHQWDKDRTQHMGISGIIYLCLHFD